MHRSTGRSSQVNSYGVIIAIACIRVANIYTAMKRFIAKHELFIIISFCNNIIGWDYKCTVHVFQGLDIIM